MNSALQSETFSLHFSLLHLVSTRLLNSHFTTSLATNYKFLIQHLNKPFTQQFLTSTVPRLHLHPRIKIVKYANQIASRVNLSWSNFNLHSSKLSKFFLFFYFVLSLPLPFTVNIMRESLAVFVLCSRTQSTHFDAFNIHKISVIYCSIKLFDCSSQFRCLQFAFAICICRERERPAGFALRCATRCGWAKLVRGNCPTEASVIRWDILYVLPSVVCRHNIYMCIV